MARPTSRSRISSPAEAAKGCDVALLALPHKVTAAKVPELIAAGVKIVDMSGDFRLRDAATYEKFYGAKHPHPELLGTFVYGLPELNREEIKKAQYVASPGCFATTIELALLPLARAGLLDGATIHVHGHHRLVGVGHRAAGGDAPSEPRGQPQDLQAARAPARARDRADARRRGREGRRAAVRPGLGAADARHLRDLLPRAAGGRRRGAPRDAVRRELRARAVRAAPEEAAARGRGRRGLQPLRGRLRGRCGRPRQAHGHLLLQRSTT